MEIRINLLPKTYSTNTQQKMVMALSDFMINYWYILVLAVILFMYCIYCHKT